MAPEFYPKIQRLRDTCTHEDAQFILIVQGTPFPDLHEGTQRAFLVCLDAFPDDRPVRTTVVEQAGKLQAPHHSLGFRHPGNEVRDNLRVIHDVLFG